MRLVDDALHIASHAYLAAPTDRLRAALVALADRQMLISPDRAAQIAEQARVEERDRIRAAVEAELLADFADYPDSPCLQVYRDGLRAALRAVGEAPTATPAPAELTVWRAECVDTGIPIGTYLTGNVAREHCDDLIRREDPVGAHTVHWRAEDDGSSTQLMGTDADEQETGYYVIPVVVSASYDPEVDE